MVQSIQHFIQSRRPRWERLERLVRCFEKGEFSRREAGEILGLGGLYRDAAADLARLQASREEGMPPDELETFLNQLVARAYGQIYRSSPPRWEKLREYLVRGLPEVFRETASWTLFAMGIFLLGFFHAFFAALSDPSFVPLIVPANLIRQVEGGNVWFDHILAVKPAASSMIMTNNISVSFLAFALGMTMGLGTLYLMAFNGLLVGALAGLCHLNGLDLPFWSFVLPHGVIELTAVFMAGGAGFYMGTALFVPGDLPRKEALVSRARKAVRLVLGCVPLLVVAGIIEGFFSPAHVPASLKFALAAFLLLLLLCYLLITPGGKASGPGN
ncbi:MAG: stage II sporulation protein M [Deltaproteobacteria bacterium]|nr:stage II sporulation protein M [Deltaproteobacteria bacterium]